MPKLPVGTAIFIFSPYGNYAKEQESAATIKEIYQETGYIIDTHTAVAAAAYEKYEEDSKVFHLLFLFFVKLF